MNSRSLKLLLIPLGLALAWFAYSLMSGPPSVSYVADGPRIAHAQGETVVPANPQRVVAFDWAALDILDALGVEVIGVAGDSFPPYLARYEKPPYLKLGTLFEPDYEAVYAAQPDLIFTGGRSSSKYKKLLRLAPTVDLGMQSKDFLVSVFAHTEMLATIFGKQERAQELIQELRTSIEALQKKTSQGGTGLILLTTGGRISAYGPGSRFGFIHEDFQVPEAAPGLQASIHGEAIHAEFIREKNPDWLFVIDRDAAVGKGEAAQQILDNELVRETSAWKKQQVIYLDPITSYIVGGGVNALSQLVKQIDQAYDQAPIKQ